MSCAKLVAPLRDALVHATWTQWGAMGFGAMAPTPAQAIVDPEALVLASLALEADEKRLERVMQMWLRSGSRLLSTGRIKNLAEAYPSDMKDSLAGFAAMAFTAGDLRWKSLMGKAKTSANRPAVEAVVPDLRYPASLMLRMRLALGVGIKGDALAFLLGRVGFPASCREIALSTGYFERAVRRAVEDLVAARLVEIRPTSPTSFFAKWTSWEKLLGVDENHAPLWRFWHELYAGTLELIRWGKQADDNDWTPYVAASRLRDAFEGASPALLRAGASEQPDWALGPERWLHEMPSVVEAMSRRLRGVL